MHDPEVIGFMALIVVLFFVLVCVLAHHRGRSIIGTIILCFTMTPFIAMGLVLLIGPDHVVLARRAKRDELSNPQL